MRTRDYFAIAGIVLLVLVLELRPRGPAGRWPIPGWRLGGRTTPKSLQRSNARGGNPASVADDAPEAKSSLTKFSPRSTYRKRHENIWGNGPKMDWKAVPTRPSRTLYRGPRRPARAVNRPSPFFDGHARTFLRDATWVVQYVSITGDGTLVDYLTTLNARLGGTYTVVLKPPVP